MRPYNFSFHTTLRGHLRQTTWKRFSYKDINQYGNSLAICIRRHYSLIGCTTESFVADVLPDVVKTMGRRSSDSFQRYWCSLGEIYLNHVWSLPATSQMHIRWFGLSCKLAIYPSFIFLPGASWGFFFRPSQVTNCVLSIPHTVIVQLCTLLLL